MPIKDILTVLDLAGDQPAAKYALEFGRNYDAHVTGLAVSFEPVVPAFAAAPMPVDYLQAAHEQAVAAAGLAVVIALGHSPRDDLDLAFIETKAFIGSVDSRLPRAGIRQKNARRGALDNGRRNR